MDRNIIVAMLSIPRIKWDKEAAFQQAERRIREAASLGAHIVCSSESFLDGYVVHDEGLTFEHYRTAAEAVPDGPYARRLLALARELKIYIVAGLTELDGEHIYNSAILISPQGEVIGKHHKIRDVGPGQAEALNTPGERFQVFDTTFGKVGMMICADRWTPELYRLLALQGAEVIFIPAAGDCGSEDTELNLRNMARENGVFIVYANIWNALVIDPYGNVATRVKEMGRVVLQEIDLDMVPGDRFRTLRPTLRTIYRSLFQVLECQKE